MARNKIERFELALIGKFAPHWEEMTLQEVCEQVTDGTHDSPKESKTGFPLVTGKAIKNRRIDFSIPYLISEPEHKKVVSRSRAERDDILFANIGNSIGDLVRVQTDKEFSIKNVALFKPNKNLINPKFLEYYLFSPQVQNFIKNSTKGSAQPFLGLATLRGFPVAVPPKKEGDLIAELLGSLDEKIELNRKTNQTLEQMAQALFKSWFVDFDPVFDNALASGVAVSEFPEALQKKAELRQQVQQSIAKGELDAKPLPEDIRQLFPSEFEQTDEPSIGINGWIPKGWESCSMNELFDIASSKRVFAKDYVESGVPFFRGKEITELSQGNKVNTEIFITDEKYQELKDKAGAPKEGDILITSVGTIGNTYLVKPDDKFYFKDGNLTWVKGYKKSFMPHYLKEWFNSYLAKEAIERIKIGTTQQAITIKALNTIGILSPDSDIIGLFESHLKGIYQKQHANFEQINQLAKLRDTLLPKIISGELSIPTAKDCA